MRDAALAPASYSGAELRRRLLLLRARVVVDVRDVRRRVLGVEATARCTFRCSERSVRSADPLALDEPPALSFAS